MLSLITFKSDAQYDPLFTQYMFNEMFINPAYAGSRDVVSATALYRDQWVGMEGAPKTQTVSIHGPLMNKKVGLGLSFMNESIGVEKKIGVFGNYAYRVQTSENGRLALGLQGGLINMRENYLDVITHDPNDIQFSENIQKMVPNAGFGLYYNTKEFYAGLSVPRLIENYVDQSAGLEIKNKFNHRNLHYFITSGYVFTINPDLKLKPMTMIKASDGATVQCDVSLAAYFKDIFWIGATFRTGAAAALFTQINLTKQLRLGYSYDYTTNRLNKYNSGSHEITLGYDFPIQKTGILTPRYF
jgi:type IX secretion system PorP/SprF family membrane protein